MADYPILSPTLSALQQTKDNPAGTEDASKLDDCLRQTRNWMYDFLTLYIDSSTGKLRKEAFAGTAPVPAGSIRGTNATSGAQQEISQGSVRTQDLADASITTPKLGVGAVTNSAIADGTIQGGKLADGSITSGKIAAGVFTANNIADGSV